MTRFRGVLLAAGILAALAAPLAPPAMAQDAPPPPTGGRSYSPLPGYGILLVLGGMVIAVSLWSSKRSHQDL
ncbi:MAG: hypothetical protein ACO3YY_00515 [Phycisphaerales bacterium]|jgi:hypothetical protein|nr:hypothetical protein [Planctomycetota bacterium]